MQLRKVISVFLINTISGLVLFSYLYYSQQGTFPQLLADWKLLTYIIAGSNFIGFSVVFVNSLFNRIPIWRKKIGIRFMLGIIINYITIIALTLIVLWIFLKINKLSYTLKTLLQEYNEIKVRVYILVLVLDILYVVFDFLIYSYKYYAYGQIQNARLAREQMELQFEALKTQLSPHYLFNSLNTISSLIYKDVNQTEEYIRKLAGTYQYILASDKIRLITLKKEIEFIKDYCFLLNIRFGKAFKAYIDVDEKSAECLIPPISIQILIENAVKHNVFDSTVPLEVDIITTNNHVSVKNKILKAPGNRESFKIGLSNIRKRYKVLTDKPVKIRKNEYFGVELPLLKSGNNG